MHIALIVGVAVALIVAYVGFKSVQDATARNSRRGDWAIFLVRWLTGGHWTGRPQTDAGWTRKGTKALTQTGFAPRFYFWPRWKRLGLRSAVSFGPFAVLYGILTGKAITLGALTAVTAAWAAWAVWKLYRVIARSRHRREWTNPLHEAIAPLAGMPLSARPSSWIEINKDRSRAVFRLPASFNDSERQRERLAEVAAKRLGIESPEITYNMSGKDPTLTLSASTMPTRMVRLSDIRRYIGQSARDVLVLGLGRHGNPVDVSLYEDSPHVGASMGSGAGKSTLARLIAAQSLHKGAIVLILDIKKISHPWARGLPNVAYCDSPELVHEALTWLGTELDRRNNLAKFSADYEGNISATVGARLVIIGEELNLTANRLRSYWRDTLGQSGTSPALLALQDVAFAGRQVGMNLVTIGQMLTARVVGGTSGGGEARENIGVRMLGRYTKRNWDMLVPEFPMPSNSNVLGRIQVVASGAVRECQVANITGAQARELALSGDIAVLPGDIPGIQVTANYPAVKKLAISPPQQGSSATDAVDNRHDIQPATLQPVTLAEAVEHGLIKYKLSSLRTFRRSDPNFPKPVDRPANGNPTAHYYNPIELSDYEIQRGKK